jgi:RHH-type proline utilization regulon transcriptional repressor/proline dehydrogenase/delta 1-pyrroline-5-carboxylate dehydrogenase
VEDRIQAIGHELYRRLRRHRGPLARLDDAIVHGAASRPELRAALLRFVDVYPACSGAADVARHLGEHLDGVENGPAGLRSIAWLGTHPRGGGSSLAAPAAIGVRRMARRFIIGTTPADALSYLERRWRRGVAASVDLLGELSVTEAEAEAYCACCLDALDTIARGAASWPDRELLERDSAGPIPRTNLSVKVTAMAPRLKPQAPWVGVEDARERLRELLRRANALGAHLHVDMEQVDTRDTTLELVLELLAEPEFADGPSAGVVVQAYLTDSRDELERLLAWGGEHPRATPLTIRLVKGAYWDHEIATAMQRGWRPPVYVTKDECDANFERLTRLLLEAPRDRVRPAVASHNLRSLAHAIASNEASGAAASDLELQVLHGLGDSLADALADMGFRVRAYCPIGDLVSGMGYLVRRLLENTANQSFLQHQAAGESVDDLLRAPGGAVAA